MIEITACKMRGGFEMPWLRVGCLEIRLEDVVWVKQQKDGETPVLTFKVRDLEEIQLAGDDREFFLARWESFRGPIITQ